MEQFDAQIKKDGSDRLTIMEIPFDAKAVFRKPKGTIYVSGTINGIGYRGKLLSRGNGKFIMVLNKAMQKSIGFDGQAMTARVTMSCEDLDAVREDHEKMADITSDMDVLTAIKTRQSIRKFTSKPVSQDMVNAILCAGMHAPTAKNKRPYHFIMIRDRRVPSDIFFTPLNIKYLIHDILHRQIPVLHLTDSHPIPDHYNAVRYPDYLLQV